MMPLPTSENRPLSSVSNRIIAIAMGDPLGIGPEIVVKLFLQFFRPHQPGRSSLQDGRPVVIGNAAVLNQALELVRRALPDLDRERLWHVRRYDKPLDIPYEPYSIPVLEVGNDFWDKIDLLDEEQRIREAVQQVSAVLSAAIFKAGAKLLKIGVIDASLYRPHKQTSDDFSDAKFCRRHRILC